MQNVGANTNVTFRIVNFGGTSSSGTWYLYNTLGTTAPDLAIQGTVTQVLPANVTPPTLAIALVGSDVVFSWPSTAATYPLQHNADLTSTNWTGYAGTIVTNGVSKTATITAPAGNLFFRLIAPSS